MKKDTHFLIDALSSGPVRQYLAENEHSDLRRIILKHKEILGVPVSRLLEQITIRRKAKDKLPLYYATPGIIYPPQENFEQSSSETTATFKSDIVSGLIDTRSSHGADITSGFGVDAFFLSRKLARFDCVESNASLIEISRFNHKLLGATNIYYHQALAEDFLRSGSDEFDLIYVDPSRRTAARKKIIGLEDSQPDIVKLLPLIWQRTKWLMIKASPLMDLQAGVSQLSFVKRVYVVSVHNECKELLFLCERNHKATPLIEATNLLADGSMQTFTFTFPDERTESAQIGDPMAYLYEPNASILKAGAFKSVAARYGVTKIHPNTHLYTASTHVDSFPGRKFRIDRFVRPDRAEVRTHLPDGQANVTTRNYPLSAEELKKKCGLTDGGEKFLIGFSGVKKKYVVIASRL